MPAARYYTRVRHRTILYAVLIAAGLWAGVWVYANSVASLGQREQQINDSMNARLPHLDAATRNHLMAVQRQQEIDATIPIETTAGPVYGLYHSR